MTSTTAPLRLISAPMSREEDGSLLTWSTLHDSWTASPTDWTPERVLVSLVKIEVCGRIPSRMGGGVVSDLTPAS